MNKKDLKIDPVTKTSTDLLDEQTSRLKEIFPEAFTEGKVDFEKLRATLGDLVEDGPERYSFTWAGKRDAIRLLQTPTRATLVPDREESVEFDKTQHLFIEGDNLEVLKLLYKPYFGRVKMVYIDPPYNTGKDFIYPDNYADPLESYLELTGQKDTNGNLLTSNPETSGRYHSTWLSMMYPRLFIARQLLREDGVIFVSIDDHEVNNLRLLMNEIFGEENFIAQMVWEKGRKNDAKLFSVGHEYMVVYARSRAKLRELKTIWREPKPGADEIWNQYCYLRKIYGNDDRTIEMALEEWYRKLPKGHPSKALSRYKHIDKYGPWRDRDISWPGGGGPRYDVIHPVTGKPCKVPPRGWGFANSEAMQRQIDLGLVEFREDHTSPPFRKAHLVPVLEELDDDNSSQEYDGEDENEEEFEVGMQVMSSVIYKQSQVAVKYLRTLLGAKVFDNPKDHEVLARLIRYVTSPNDVILDFFAGACSTAEAVLQLNHEEGSDRHFIMVQLPEPTPEKSPARKANYKTIADIGKDRIRRVIQKVKDETAHQLPLDTRDTPEDLGFRVFKLGESNFRSWKGVDEDTSEAYAQQMALFTDPLVDNWQAEDVLYEVALKEGYGLNCRVEQLPEITNNTLYRVTDPGKQQSFTICLDPTLHLDTLRPMNLSKDDLFICRDIALNDETAANLALQCRLKTI